MPAAPLISLSKVRQMQIKLFAHFIRFFHRVIERLIDSLETIFPPVFGKRLQAQVVKKGERVVMEVEITGTPEPTVTWYKDDVPVRERPPEVRLRQLGNCYLLVIEKGNFLLLNYLEESRGFF